MLERVGRCLAVVVPLLFLALGDNTSLAAGVGPNQCAGCSMVRTAGFLPTSAGVLNLTEHDNRYGLASVAADLLKPPADVATSLPSSSSYLPSLPAVPKPVLMVSVGFLCISLVHDRKAWLALIAFSLSSGHYWLSTVPPRAWHHRNRRPVERLSLWDAIALRKSDMPLCILSHHKSCFSTFGANSKKGPEDSPAIITPQRNSLRLLPNLTLRPDRIASRISQLMLAQLARGPPRGP